MGVYFEVLADKPALVERGQALVVAKISEAIAARGRCTLALAGGSTPRPLYEGLAADPSLPSNRLHVFWGDERYVPADHPDSNQHMARAAWLDREPPFPAANIYPMPTTGGDPATDAALYEQQLQDFFALAPGEFPAFDIILLGMGDDGHTASLFPHTEALAVGDRLVTVGNKGDSQRLTLTYPVLNAARCVIFLVAGANKQTALTAVRSPQGDWQTYPSGAVRPTGDLWWLVDRTAAGEG
ncbi:MAG: 6-phosphogluconolactonase [Cyanobacteria bacterium J06641_5]